MKDLRSTIIKLLHLLGLYKVTRWIVTRSFCTVWRLFGVITQREKRKLSSYLDEYEIHKLHLGCGLNYMDGWLNTDLVPDSKRIHLDVSKRFPFPDESFNYAFNEHMIEHLPYITGKKMLSECYRILKVGGTLRITTPDLNFLINMYQNEQTKVHRDYIVWNAKNFIGKEAPHDAISVLNNYVRDWGHQYIYDVQSLRKILSDIGFINIKELNVGSSSHPDLQHLENESRHPEGFLSLESLVLEAEKPES